MERQPDDASECVRLYTQGLTVNEVADAVKVSKCRVRKHLDEANIVRRTHSERFSRTLPDHVLTDAWTQSEPGAWACGMVVTDGTFRLNTHAGRSKSPSPTLRLTLQRRDRDGVVRFAEAFGLSESDVIDTHYKDGLVSVIEFTHPRLRYLHDVLGCLTATRSTVLLYLVLSF